MWIGWVTLVGCMQYPPRAADGVWMDAGTAPPRGGRGGSATIGGAGASAADGGHSPADGGAGHGGPSVRDDAHAPNDADMDDAGPSAADSGQGSGALDSGSDIGLDADAGPEPACPAANVDNCDMVLCALSAGASPANTNAGALSLTVSVGTLIDGSQPTDHTLWASPLVDGALSETSAQRTIEPGDSVQADNFMRALRSGASTRIRITARVHNYNNGWSDSASGASDCYVAGKHLVRVVLAGSIHETAAQVTYEAQAQLRGY